MTTFIVTPTNVDYIQSLFRDPHTGKWTIPILTYNLDYVNPYYKESDPLNDDPSYRNRVVDNIYMRLTEKWLYKDPLFRELGKYFIVNVENGKGNITLINSLDKKTDTSKLTNQDMLYIFKYINKYFISKKFVKKTLKDYINLTHMKWYDIFNNIDNVKSDLRKKLKKLIVSTIYELQSVKK